MKREHRGDTAPRWLPVLPASPGNQEPRRETLAHKAARANDMRARMGGAATPTLADYVVQRQGPLEGVPGRSPFLGFGAEEATLLDNWRHGLATSYVVDMTAMLRGLPRHEVAGLMERAVTTFLRPLLAAPRIAHLAARRLTGEALAEDELCAWEYWLWERVFVWPPFDCEEARRRETEVLWQARSIILSTIAQSQREGEEGEAGARGAHHQQQAQKGATAA